MIHYVKNYTNATHLVIMINPRHQKIYDFIGFKKFADTKLYPFVNKPAVPMILDVDEFFNSSKHNIASEFACKNSSVLVPKRSYSLSAEDVLDSLDENIQFIKRINDMQFDALIKQFPNLSIKLIELRKKAGVPVKYLSNPRKAMTRMHSEIFDRKRMLEIDKLFKNGLVSEQLN